MELYCVAVFIDPTRIDGLERVFGQLSFPLSPMDGVENGFHYHSFEVSVNHVGLIICEANHFHKHLDFEIGFAEFTQDSFLTLRQRIEGSGLKTKWVEGNQNSFVFSEDAHGPFFFSNSDRFSNGSNLNCVRGRIASSDFKKFQILQKSIFDDRFARSIRLEESNDATYKIQQIVISGDFSSMGVFRCDRLLTISILSGEVVIDFEE